MKKLASIAFMVFVALLLAGAMFVLSLMKRPLGPSLALDAPPTQPAAVEMKAAAPPAQAEKFCGNSGQMAILVIGQGLVENSNLIRSGAIRLVVVDFDRPAVSLLSMPAELWVDARALKDPTIPFEKLDLIYHHAFLRNRGVPEEVAHVKGTQALAQALVDNFAFVPDHYATLLQQPFVDLVDALGGIDVDLPEEVVPANGDFGVYPKGPQHLDGRRALNLTRADTAEGYDPWARFDRQEIVLYGLLEAALRPDNWDKADDLVKEARKAVLTDLSVDQAMDLKCMLEAVGDQAEMLQVEPEMVTIDEQGRWIPDTEAIKALIRGMYGE